MDEGDDAAEEVEKEEDVEEKGRMQSEMQVIPRTCALMKYVVDVSKA